MPKPKNDAIGECACPVAGCELVCKVFKFRARENVKQQRLAGKLYLRCPEHGQLGADGARAMQEFILEYSTIWGHENRNPSAGDAPASTPASAPASSSNGTTSAPAKAASGKPPTPAPATSPATRDVWNL